VSEDQWERSDDRAAAGSGQDQPERTRWAPNELPPPPDHEYWGPRPTPWSQQEEPRPGRSRSALAAALAALLLLSGGVGIGWLLSGHGTSSSPIATGRQAPGPGRAGSSARAVASRVTPAVVDINTTIASNPFSQGSPPAGEAAGTGMIISSGGEILTNNHVVAGASKIQVTLAGGGTYDAQVVGADTANDVAVLQLSGVSGLPTVTFAAPSTISTGENVVAIGNAMGRGGQPAVTSGKITSIGRTITVNGDNGTTEQLTNVIQTSAPIQPGDSGGPLVNTSGQVIGMITAGSRGFSTADVGFAIPASHAQTIISQIHQGQSGGSLIIGPAGYLGVEVRGLDPAIASRLGLSVTSGVLVTGVNSGTPAQQVGINQDDVITAIDGQSVSSQTALGAAIHQHHPGQKITVTWVDRTGTHTATVTLIPGPAV
jgi:S1-C subfamily serine protease